MRARAFRSSRRLVAAAAWLTLAAAAAAARAPRVQVIGAAPDAAPDTSAALAAALALSIASADFPAATFCKHNNKTLPCPAASTSMDSCLTPPDEFLKCYIDTLTAAMRSAEAVVALAVVPATSQLSGQRLKDIGLTEMGDAVPPWRRTCFAKEPAGLEGPAGREGPTGSEGSTGRLGPAGREGPAAREGRGARSLLDLYDPVLAADYSLTNTDDRSYISKFGCETKNCKFIPERCTGENSTCAILLTTDETEVRVLAEVVETFSLHAEVRAVGGALAEAAGALRGPALLCARAPALQLPRLRARALAPPHCDHERPDRCPFEPRRLLKIAKTQRLGRYTAIVETIEGFHIKNEQLLHLATNASKSGYEKAAELHLNHNPRRRNIHQRVMITVFLPKNFDVSLNDRHVAPMNRFFRSAFPLRLKDSTIHKNYEFSFRVSSEDSPCSITKSYDYLMKSFATWDYGTLSAVVGPECSSAFTEAVNQAPTHRIPLLAYTAQAPPAREEASGGPPLPSARALVLLGGGDARRVTDLWGALLERMRWRRIAVLSDLGLHAALDAARLKLPSRLIEILKYDENRNASISKWVQRAAEANYKILYPYLEDARDVRTALCAGHAAGLRPGAGAVWLLPGLPAGWERGPAACAAADLAAMLEGHLRAVPAWEVDWSPSQSDTLAEYCYNCEPRLALLFDMIFLWGNGVNELLSYKPSAVYDLHDLDNVRDIFNIVTNATSNYTLGLTGPFEWNKTDELYERLVPYVVQQWRNGSYVTVGRWDGASLNMTAPLRWATEAGRAPDDGGDRCALQPLAALLGADCRTAFTVLAALLLAALVGALAALALFCRRRAEREYRAHLAELRLRAHGLKPGGLDRWEVPRERVVINRKLGTGAFGTVYGGHALLAEDRGWSAVAVKTLKAGASTEEKLDFLSEAEAMKRFDHKNVVRLLAVVTKTEPVCTVMEFMLYGDLKNYLLARRHLATEAGGADEEAAEEVSPRRLTAMALDAARALSYLAQLRYVHRDVAARNCLVSANRAVKLADFGMTRLVFENDYYRFSRKGMLPVRWMAPESLALGVFSPASDVWSFGVLLYEIVTFGSLPFQGLSNSEVLGRVKAGYTLDLPTGLKPQLEGLIKSCWRQEAKARPQAVEVAAFLADSPRLLAPCLDVPLDALPLEPDPPARDRAEARWVSWAAPASATTETTYLSADGRLPSEGDTFLPPGEGDTFLPPPDTP